MKKIIIFVSILAATAFMVFSCSKKPEDVLMMATTTSTDNTGLLDILEPEFKKDADIQLRWVAVGTGKALQMGKNCDVDILLVHAPDAEKKFIEEGYGLNRTELMYNDFIIIGPPADPAAVKNKNVTEALNSISENKSIFTSRGDNSGTHILEQQLWQKTGKTVPDRESWYIETGQGMIQTVNIAAERNGYTLTDRGTYIKYKDNHKGDPPLVILVEGDESLFNQYSAIEVNPEKCPEAKNHLAKEFISWMASEKGQSLIGDYKLLGERLFTPSVKN